MIVTLEAAKALRDVLGYPQEITQKTPGHYHPNGAYPNRVCSEWRSADIFDVIPAPDDTTALDWLEENKVIGQWWREDKRYFFDKPNGHYYSMYDHEGGNVTGKGYPMPFRNPSDLIIAIAKYHAAQHAAGGGG